MDLSAWVASLMDMAPNFERCSTCLRRHKPGQLNSFDDGKGDIATSAPCTCDEDCNDLACTSSCSCYPCDDARIYWSPHSHWTTPGVLHEQFNSLYANKQGPRRCRERYVVDYETCTPTKLKTFVQQRGIPDPYPEGITLPYYYVKLLDAADRAPSVFRFLDLPPEMRNIVYRGLLKIESRNEYGAAGSCHPEILSTCHQIHDEVSELLYSQNRVDILLHTDWRTDADHIGDASAEKLFKTVQIQNHGVQSVTQTDFECIPNGICAWPSFLRLVRNLHIEINLFQLDRVDHGGALFVKNCIRTLVASLMDRDSLRQLVIKADFGAVNSTSISDALRPLRYLEDIPKRYFCSARLSDGLARRSATLLAQINDPEQSRFNFLKVMKRVFDRADALSVLHSTEAVPAGFEDDETATKERFEELLSSVAVERTKLMKNFEQRRYGEIGECRREGRILRHLKTIRLKLDELDPDVARCKSRYRQALDKIQYRRELLVACWRNHLEPL